MIQCVRFKLFQSSLPGLFLYFWYYQFYKFFSTNRINLGPILTKLGSNSLVFFLIFLNFIYAKKKSEKKEKSYIRLIRKTSWIKKKFQSIKNFNTKKTFLLFILFLSHFPFNSIRENKKKKKIFRNNHKIFCIVWKMRHETTFHSTNNKKKTFQIFSWCIE